MTNWLKLAISVLICELVGIIGSTFNSPQISNWYGSLQKPWFTPPNYTFVIVWVTLYALMGISIYLIWQKGLRKNKIATSIFIVQLMLNGLWSSIFFGMQNIFLALIEIIILWIAILATIVLFYKINKKAAYLLIPYIIWVTIAVLLNYSIWILNI